MKYKTITTGLMALVLGVQLLNAQVYERTRKERKSFKVYENTKLEITNKYGNINLFTWDVDSVRIEIDLNVKASKESKADKIFEYIDFEFSSSRYYVVARTNFRQNQGNFWSELSDLANTVFSGNNKAQIDYTVYLPERMNVKLENKFGNIYCKDHSGKFEAVLSNGDFKAGDLLGECDLDLSFGHAGINTIAQGKLKGSYLEMDLGKSNELHIESKSSTYNIGMVGILNIESRRDKFYIDQTGSILGSFSFSYLTLTGFDKAMQLKTEYGEVNVKGVHPKFLKMDLDARYTDINLELGQEIQCTVDIDFSETTGIYYPDACTGLKITRSEEKGNPSTLKGSIGPPAQNNPVIEISIQSGKVAFQEAIQLF